MLVWLLPVAWGAPMAPKLEIPGVKYVYDAGEVCLGSGLLVQLVRRPEAGVVAISTVVAGGDAGETAENRGAAQLVERLWLRSLADGDAGLELYAETSRDGTVYVTVGAPADLSALLALEARRLLDPLGTIDEATFESVREGLVTEMLATGEHDVRDAHRRLDAALWPKDHPYALGAPTVADVRARTLDEVKAFAAAHYRPDQTSMRIEGAIDMNTFGGLLDVAFPDALQAGSANVCLRRSSEDPPPAPATTDPVSFRAPVMRPTLYLAWSMPASWTDDDTTARLAIDHLERYLRAAALPTQGIRESWELSVTCGYIPGRQASTAMCRVAIPDRATPVETLSLVKATLTERWGPDDKALPHDANRMGSPTTLTAAYADLDRFTPRALANRGWSTWYGVADPGVVVALALHGLEPAQILDVGRQWLTSERVVAVALVPDAAAKADGALLIGPPRFATPAAPAWHAVAPSWEGIVRAELTNGLDVWTVTRPDTAWISTSALVLPGGWATSPHVGETEFIDVVQLYAMNVSGGTLAERAAVTWSSSYDPQSVEWSTLGPAANLHVQLWRQRAGLENPRIVDRYRHQALDRRVIPWDEHLRERPDAVATTRRERHLLPGDRASDPWWERNRKARYVTETQVEKWRRDVFRPDQAVLVVAGATPPVEVAEIAEQQMSGWRVGGERHEITLAPLPAPPERRLFLFDDGLSPVSEVTVSCRVPGRTDANAAAFDVLDAALERGLYQSLEEPGAGWAAQSTLTPIDARVGLLTLRVDVRPEDGNAALTAMWGLLERVSTQAPGTLLDWARLSATAAHGRAFASAGSTEATLSTAVAEGRSIEALRQRPADIARVDAAALSGLLVDCAGHEAATIVGPGVTVGPAGIAAEQVDWPAEGKAIAVSLE